MSILEEVCTIFLMNESLWYKGQRGVLSTYGILWCKGSVSHFGVLTFTFLIYLTL